MPNALNPADYVGKKYGKLTIIKLFPAKGGTPRKCECLCECGNTTIVNVSSLLRENTKSCGCSHYTYGHGQCSGYQKTRIYRIYWNMKCRCYNEKTRHYNIYGGRGIRICDEWFNDFQAFHDWAMANGYRDDLTLDRIDNDGDYSPDNCRWTTQDIQCRNQGINSRNTSGVKGVRFFPRTGKWVTSITVGGKLIHLGYFDTIEEAAAARKQAEIDYWENDKEPPQYPKSETPGVTYRKSDGKWEARIGVSGKRIHLGAYGTFDEALAARKAAELKYRK